MALREILAKFGVEFDTKELKEGHKEVEHTKESLKELVEVLVGAAFIEGIKSFIEGIAKTGVELHALSTQTGLSTENIQLFDYAASQAGVSAEEMHAGVRKLSVSLAGAAHGGSSAAGAMSEFGAASGEAGAAAGEGAAGAGQQGKAFQELGVAVKDAEGKTRDLNEVLPDIIKGFGDLKDPGQRARLAVDLFGRAGVRLVGFLSEGAEGLEKFRAEFEELGGGMSEEAIHAAEEYEHSVHKLELAFTSIKSKIGAELFPELAKLFTAMAKGVGAFSEFAKHTELAKGFLAALGTIGVAALVGLLAPFAPLIAAISTVTLFFDDLFNFIEGNDSVIGAALNSMFGPDVTEKVRGGLKDIDKEVKGFFEDMLEHPKKFVEDIKQLFAGLSVDIKKFLGLSGGSAQDAIDKGQAVSYDQKHQAESDTKFFDSLGTTFGSKGLSKFLYNSLGGVFGKDFALNLFDKNADGSSKQPGAPDVTANGLLAPPATGAAAQASATQQPVPIAIQSAPEDWFAHLANSFGSVFGGEPGSAAPVPVAVPGQGATAITKTVEQNNTNHFHLEAGTPEETKSSVEEGVTKGLGNERRNAQLSLENTGGA